MLIDSRKFIIFLVVSSLLKEFQTSKVGESLLGGKWKIIYLRTHLDEFTFLSFFIILFICLFLLVGG